MSADDAVNATVGRQNASTNSGLCDQWSWSERPVSEVEACNDAVMYTGSVCLQELLSWQECVGPLAHEQIMVGTQAILDDAMIGTIERILTSESTECQILGLRFICQFNYPLHDCATNSVFLATREDCLVVSTEVCVSLWNFAIESEFGQLLPNCEHLPESDLQLDSGKFRNTYKWENNHIYTHRLAHESTYYKHIYGNIYIYILLYVHNIYTGYTGVVDRGIVT